MEARVESVFKRREREGRCRVCGVRLVPNNSRQRILYCSKKCRAKRHEKVVGV
jgi:hypothetical protein